jgi:monofunctional biosynthetic peptidoglycan transglycosylase
VKQNWRRRLVRWTLIGLAAAFLVMALPVVAMRWMDPWYSAFMLDAALDASRAGKANYHTDYRWKDLEQISPHAAVAVIAAEDQFFPFHTGFDFKSIREAVRYNEKQSSRRKPRVRGASTISQQVAKNLFLWPGAATCARASRSTSRCSSSSPGQGAHSRGVPERRASSVMASTAWRRPVSGSIACRPAKLGRYESATLAAVLPNPITVQGERTVRVRDEASRLDPRADARTSAGRVISTSSGIRRSRPRREPDRSWNRSADS